MIEGRRLTRRKLLWQAAIIGAGAALWPLGAVVFGDEPEEYRLYLPLVRSYRTFDFRLIIDGREYTYSNFILDLGYSTAAASFDGRPPEEDLARLWVVLPDTPTDPGWTGLAGRHQVELQTRHETVWLNGEGEMVAAEGGGWLIDFVEPVVWLADYLQ